MSFDPSRNNYPCPRCKEEFCQCKFEHKALVLEKLCCRVCLSGGVREEFYSQRELSAHSIAQHEKGFGKEMQEKAQRNGRLFPLSKEDEYRDKEEGEG